MFVGPVNNAWVHCSREKSTFKAKKKKELKMQSSGSKHHLNHLFNMHFFFKANKVHKIKAAYINKQNGCYGRLYNSLQEFLLIFQ